MTDLWKSLATIILFVLPVALIGMAVVCFGHCVSDMLDDREPTATAADQSSPELQI
jgi:hypothetical protein